MPVNGREFSSIHQNVMNCYSRVFFHEPADEIIYWLGTANMKIVLLLTQYIFENKRLSYLKKNKYTYIIGKNKQLISKINFLHVIDEINLSSSFYDQSFKSRIKNKLFFLKNILNLSKNKDINFSNGQLVEYIGYLSKEMLNYCQLNYLTPQRRRIDTNLSIKGKNLANSRLFSNYLQEFILLVTKKYPIFDRSIIEKIIFEFESIFSSSYVLFNTSLSAIEKDKSNKLLATGLGNPRHRTIIAAHRYAGSEVIGFNHGNAYATTFDPTTLIYEGISSVSQFFSSSKGHADLTTKAINNLSIDLGKAEIVYPQRSAYLPLINKLKNDPPVKNIKNVMILGYPMTSYFYPGMPYSHAFSILHLEIRLIKILKEASFRVNYKAHPNRLSEISGIFDSYVDKISVEPFESVYQSADCIVFSHYETTPFGFAMLTKKPIVLFNNKNAYKDKDAFSLISKRCRIVSFINNNQDQIIFDSNEFLDAIDNSITFNYDVVNKYAL